MFKTMLAFGIAALVGFVIYAYASQPSDRDQIRATLDEAAKASREGRSNPVMDALSSRFNFNTDANPDRNEIAKMVRQAKPDFAVLQIEPKIDDDHATLISPVKVDVSFEGVDLHTTLPKVTIKFAREGGLIYGVLPVGKWRIVGVESEGLPGL